MANLRAVIATDNLKKMRERSAERGIRIGDLFCEVFNFYSENCEDEPERMKEGHRVRVWWIVSDDVVEGVSDVAETIPVLDCVVVDAAIAFYFERHPKE